MQLWSFQQDYGIFLLKNITGKGVKVNTPDINLSSEDFSVNNGEILFGLSAIRNVGDVTAQKIIIERKNNKYLDLRVC